MAFRTIVISTHSKVEYSLNYLVFRTPENVKRVLLDEIHTVIFESTSVSVTTSLLAELVIRKIKVIFCDEKHNPISELIPYNISYNSSKKISEQIEWSGVNKAKVWKKIVQRKIFNQANCLKAINKIDKCDVLLAYAAEVNNGDTTNREGHAAKVYFNNIFYEGFARNDGSFLNACLDYGYTILLSQFNRTIVAAGYLTQIGIHHIGEFNPFNFSCDLIEPFRFIVDIESKKLTEKDDYKSVLINILNKEVTIDGKIQTLISAINIYFFSVIRAIEYNELDNIKFISYYDN